MRDIFPFINFIVLRPFRKWMQCIVYDEGTIFSGIRYAKAVPILLGHLRALKREKILCELAGCTFNVQPANLHK